MKNVCCVVIKYQYESVEEVVVVEMAILMVRVIVMEIRVAP